MTEHIQEQISAFIDDELSSEECAFLVRRLGSDATARAQMVRYAAIGSVLRTEGLIASSTLLRDRVQAALDGVATAPARRMVPTRRTPPLRARRRWAYSVAGAGVAASVAAVALFGLRTALEDGGAMAPVQAADGMAPSGRSAAPPSYVVPTDASGQRVFAPPIRLTNYLVQHGNYTSTLQRTSVHSNVVGIGKPELATAALPDAATSER